jgi:signal transduction histidine kinase
VSVPPSGTGLRAALRPWAPSRLGLAFAVAVCIVDLAVFVAPSAAGSPLLLVYAFAGYLALAWRTSAPVPVFCVLWFHQTLAAVSQLDYRPTLGVLVALYGVSAVVRTRSAVVAMLATLASTLAVSLPDELQANPGQSRQSVALYVTLLNLMIVVGTLALGRWVRRSRLRISDLETRRRRAAQEAIRAERHRLARELHDIISHSVSVMTLQAAGARRQLGVDPARADGALLHIEATGREAMVELRRLLTVLEEDPQAGVGPDADDPTSTQQQQHGLADLPQLVENVRRGGVPVNLIEEGEAVALEPSVDLSAYRIVQEALTNTMKHAGPGTRASVSLTWTPEGLVVDIRDDGGPGADPTLSTGHGLVGLQERAKAVGGSLEAGSADGTGFRVSARLPVAGAHYPDAAGGLQAR